MKTIACSVLFCLVVSLYADANPAVSHVEDSHNLLWMKQAYKMGAVLKFDGSVNVDKICPSGKKCSYNSTCCTEGCCGHQNGVCCEESGRCCPEGHECSAHGKSCVKVEDQVVLKAWSSTEVALNTEVEQKNELINGPSNDCINCRLLCCDVLGVKFCCPWFHRALVGNYYCRTWQMSMNNINR